MKRENTIGFEIRTLDNMMFRHLLAYEARRGVDELTLMHGWIIGFIYDNPDRDIFQKDIETEFSIARSTVTGILKLMEKKGYIYRESVPRDARLKRLVLTDKGRKMHEDTVVDIDFIENYIRRGISEEEIKAFFNVVRKLKENIETSELMKEAEHQ